MKIAVIGSGFYGSSLAIILSKKNDVDLYEKKSKIFNGASSCNQFDFTLGIIIQGHKKQLMKSINQKRIFLIFIVKRCLKTLLIITQLQKKAK